MQTIRRLADNSRAWGKWLFNTYGAEEALHLMPRCRWVATWDEQQVLSIVSVLLSCGACADLPEEKTGYWTPPVLHWAVVRNFPSVVRTLLQSGATVDLHVFSAAAAQGNTHVLDLLRGSMDHAFFESCRDMALVQAASGGETASIRWLLEHGADVHVAEEQPLFEASYHGHAAAVALLVECGAAVRARNDSALIAAAFKGHIEVAQIMLANGADVNSQKGRALQQATLFGHEDMCRLLVEGGANEAVIAEALDNACLKGHEAVVACLLQYGVAASSNVALANAVKKGHPGVVRLLVQAGADPEECLQAEDVQQALLHGSQEALVALEEAYVERCALTSAACTLDISLHRWGLACTTFLRGGAKLARQQVEAQRRAALLPELTVTSW
eukprot:CAMPEP_0202893218 /NCGR_PEP_ID=MMETSP1392-20130828/2836_1 /ASSEMBLY_ACC=CAM_ASM_000868 /TAXON_ID=225041 /ORGANISM="Chlamydomonas chlamydogama, Strain SAG 11-48b" /LENGTH=386 /DNA_ID=CAMNT_0049577471 /DNA_START=147 /DNA_END=1304 /DNA_ORIENTATION=-